MNRKKWIQHISGQGKKFEVLVEHKDEWEIFTSMDRYNWRFPKSEYRECEPPEMWTDVTDKCGFVPGNGERDGVKHFGEGNAVCTIYSGYRLRKVPVGRSVMIGSPVGGDEKHYAFIVEKRES